METMLDFNVLIRKEDGSNFQYEEVSRALIDAGFTWDGYMNMYTKNELENAAIKIVDSISMDAFNTIKNLEYDTHNFKDESEFKDHLFMGLRSLYNIITPYLNEEMELLAEKYDKTNWQVSDIFNGYLEGEFVNKFYDGEWT